MLLPEPATIQNSQTLKTSASTEGVYGWMDAWTDEWMDG